MAELVSSRCKLLALSLVEAGLRFDFVGNYSRHLLLCLDIDEIQASQKGLDLRCLAVLASSLVLQILQFHQREHQWYIGLDRSAIPPGGHQLGHSHRYLIFHIPSIGLSVWCLLQTPETRTRFSYLRTFHIILPKHSFRPHQQSVACHTPIEAHAPLFRL